MSHCRDLPLFCNDTPTSATYTLSLHDALPIYGCIAAFGLTVITSFLVRQLVWVHLLGGLFLIYLGIKTILTKPAEQAATEGDRKSTRLNSSHTVISYAVFCLKKKKKKVKAEYW